MLAQQIRGLGTAAPHRRHTLGSRSSHTNELPPLEPLAVPEDGDVATQLKLVRMRSDDSISAPVGGGRSALPVDLVATKPIGVPPPPPRCCCCKSGRRLWVNLCQVHDPNSLFRIRWDLVSMVVLLYCLVEIPFRVAFESDVEAGSFGDVANLIADAFFLTECYLNFRTAVSIEGKLVFDTNVIARRYIGRWFAVDFLTSLPVSNVVAASVSTDGADAASALRLARLLRVARAARLFKLLRLIKLLRVMNKFGQQNSVWTGAIKLSKFMITIFFMAHASGCVWMLIANMERTGDDLYHPDSWPSRHGLATAGAGRLYLVSLYWSLVTLTTVGYGDILPLTDWEILWASFVMFAGTCSFGYIIGNVAAVITNEDAFSALMQQKTQSINDYMKSRKLPMDMRKRIRDHFVYSWRRGTLYEENTILAELPSCMRIEVAMHLHRDLIQSVRFLRESKQDAVAQVVLRLVPMQATPRQWICHRGDIGLEMWFITSGVLEVVDESLPAGEDVIVALHKGDYVGEFALLADDPTKARRTSSLRTQDYVELYTLDRADFLDIVALVPEIHRRLHAAAQAKLAKTRSKQRTQSFRMASRLLGASAVRKSALLATVAASAQEHAASVRKQRATAAGDTSTGGSGGDSSTSIGGTNPLFKLKGALARAGSETKATGAGGGGGRASGGAPPSKVASAGIGRAKAALRGLTIKRITAARGKSAASESQRRLVDAQPSPSPPPSQSPAPDAQPRSLGATLAAAVGSSPDMRRIMGASTNMRTVSAAAPQGARTGRASPPPPPPPSATHDDVGAGSDRVTLAMLHAQQLQLAAAVQAIAARLDAHFGPPGTTGTTMGTGTDDGDGNVG